MKKVELIKIWKQLDGACEALEKLSEHEEGQELLKGHNIDLSAIVGIKNDVEELINQKTRTAQVDLK